SSASCGECSFSCSTGSSAAGGATFSVYAGVGAGTGADSPPGAPSPATSRRTSSDPTARTSPTRPPSASTRPFTGEGTCTVALSVMTSAKTWSSTTSSPSLTCHSTSSTSAMPSPISGILIVYSAMSLPFSQVCVVFRNQRRQGRFTGDDTPDGIRHPARAGEIGPLVGMGIRRVPPGHALDGRLQVEKAVFLNQGGQFRAETAGQRGLVQHQATASLADRADQRFDVQRPERAQVDDLDIEPGFLHGGFRDIHHGAVSDERQLRAFPVHPSLAQRNGVVPGRHIAHGVARPG